MKIRRDTGGLAAGRVDHHVQDCAWLNVSRIKPMLGRYAFILPDRVERGELGPLRDLRRVTDEG